MGPFAVGVVERNVANHVNRCTQRISNLTCSYEIIDLQATKCTWRKQFTSQWVVVARTSKAPLLDRSPSHVYCVSASQQPRQNIKILQFLLRCRYCQPHRAKARVQKRTTRVRISTRPPVFLFCRSVAELREENLRGVMLSHDVWEVRCLHPKHYCAILRKMS